MINRLYPFILILFSGCLDQGDSNVTLKDAESSNGSESAENESKLQRLEGKKDTGLIHAFLDWQQTQPYLIAHGESQHPNYYFAFDVNGDGIKEIVYEDYYRGQERSHVRIFQKNDDGYTKVFEDFQNIAEIDTGSPKEQLVISDHGCCDNPCMRLKYYSLENKSGQISFELDRQVGYMRGLETTSGMYMVAFTIDSSGLIANPELTESHVVAVLKKRATILALGESTFNEEEWVFIEAYYNSVLRSDCFDLEPGLTLRGWIPKEYLRF